MIPLTLRAAIHGMVRDTVVRVSGDDHANGDASIEQTENGVTIRIADAVVHVQSSIAADFIGDVLLIQPGRGVIQRLVRAASEHNTFLVTERCDQLCVMCSQPPKKTHVDMFAHYAAAALLAPSDAVLGITGGEPTLYKDELFRFLSTALTLRPDLSFHLLSNGQHFQEDDIDFLSSDAGRKILWGVPLYSHDPETHDRLVGKEGAFDLLMDGLAILCRSGASVELRTVVMRDNVDHLPALAAFIATHVPFAAPWAIMQLENIGFARNRWRELFFDHSTEFDAIAAAIDLARLYGIKTTLYNFPLCTVPMPYRRFAPSTISDWKRRYEPRCDGCIGKKFCGGFFEWHPNDASYGRLGLQ